MSKVNTMTETEQKTLVAKLREAGLPQAFFTQVRKMDSVKQLRRILASTWTVYVKGEKVTKSFTTNEKKAATLTWG